MASFTLGLKAVPAKFCAIQPSFRPSRQGNIVIRISSQNQHAIIIQDLTPGCPSGPNAKKEDELGGEGQRNRQGDTEAWIQHA